jgi:hypothetical protein
VDNFSPLLPHSITTPNRKQQKKEKPQRTLSLSLNRERLGKYPILFALNALILEGNLRSKPHNNWQ